MKKILSIILLLMMSSQLAVANDRMERLLNQQCMSCHGNEIYTSPNRKVKNPVQLEKQLQRCNHVIGGQMDMDTITQLMNYLDKKYYKF